MFFWILSLICLFFSLRIFGSDLSELDQLLGLNRQRRELFKIEIVFRELEETLLAGLVPPSTSWGLVRALPEPWGALAADSLKELRNCGGSLLPTLKRLRILAVDHGVTLGEARARSSQAVAQAAACSVLVPLLGGSLYLLLPGVEQNIIFWIFACILAFTLTGLGAIWMLRLAEVARWGGLRGAHRSWVLSSQCAGEKFLALLRSGTPPDIAWKNACEFLTVQGSSELAAAWGHSIWENPIQDLRQGAENSIITAGRSIRKAVQISLMEGRPCADRVEAALLALRQDIKVQVERQLSLLATRALKPLFICVAPALFGLLVCGLWLASQEVLGNNATY